MDLADVSIEPDDRYDYGETKNRACSPIDGRLHMLVLTMCGSVLRAISLRKANAREAKDMTKKTKPPADFDENPEWTAEDFARAKPFSEVFPEQFKAWKRMGRPPVEAPKIHIGFRLPPTW